MYARGRTAAVANQVARTIHADLILASVTEGKRDERVDLPE
jgi:hypothetical protein